MKKYFSPCLIVLVLLILFACKKNSGERIITVSILPQKYFVERIVGDKFKINVMVGPGREPHDYEPLPGQMIDLSESQLYFSIGVPFEKSWLKKIQDVNPEMKIIPTENGITLRNFESDTVHEDENSNELHEHEGSDPHIWLSPKLVKIQSENIYNAVVSVDPDNEKLYKKNLDEFFADLDNLSKNINEAFSKLETKEFMVFHPAWGYFADEFGLKQIPVETEGKDPTPKQLAHIINEAKEKKIKVIFVQEQFSTKSANAIAKEINGSVITIDPLSKDYINNLENIAKKIIDNN